MPASAWGEQTGTILDANTLKQQAGDLDEAAILAQGQMREEERKLRDLQALNDAKKLVRLVPSEKAIGDWIDQAKSLDRVITH